VIQKPSELPESGAISGMGLGKLVGHAQHSTASTRDVPPTEIPLVQRSSEATRIVVVEQIRVVKDLLKAVPQTGVGRDVAGEVWVRIGPATSPPCVEQPTGDGRVAGVKVALDLKMLDVGAMCQAICGLAHLSVVSDVRSGVSQTAIDVVLRTAESGRQGLSHGRPKAFPSGQAAALSVGQCTQEGHRRIVSTAKSLERGGEQTPVPAAEEFRYSRIRELRPSE
jgi:hypothetical protein